MTRAELATNALEPLTLTIDDFCAVTGLGRTKAYELISRKDVEKLVIGGRTLITYVSIKALIERSRNAQSQLGEASQ